jgi:hypothetical protein
MWSPKQRPEQELSEKYARLIAKKADDSQSPQPHVVYVTKSLLEGTADLGIQLSVQEVVVRVREAERRAQQGIRRRTLGRVTVQ